MEQRKQFRSWLEPRAYDAMRYLNLWCLASVMTVVLTCWSISPSLAQLAEADALNKRVEELYQAGKYAEAIPLSQRALAIREKALDPNHAEVAASLNKLALLYFKQSNFTDALPLIRRTIKNKNSDTEIALQVLFGARRSGLIKHEEALEASLQVLDNANKSAAALAIRGLAKKFADPKKLAMERSQLAALLRESFDLEEEAINSDNALSVELQKEPSVRDAASELRIRHRIAAIAMRRQEVQAVLVSNYPRHAVLWNLTPFSLNDVHELLAKDEALVVFNFGLNSYAWVITATHSDWVELRPTAKEIEAEIASLRASLIEPIDLAFNATLAYKIYQETFGIITDKLIGKTRLSVVTNGALTSLPLQLLVSKDPRGKALKNIDWLVRSYAISNLPSVGSLFVLRSDYARSSAPKPMVAFADPVFSKSKRDQAQIQKDFALSNRSITRFYRGHEIDTAKLGEYLPQLPGTRKEVETIANALKVDSRDLYFGLKATERMVKQVKLGQYRIVYFATHGLVAGEIQDFTKTQAEPALVLTMPDKPDEEDDGLLQPSEVLKLELNADWVVLSACNTAAEDGPGAEALSGLARSFFSAGARSLIVSHWRVDDLATAQLMSSAFTLHARRRGLSHAEVLQQAMLRMLNDAKTNMDAHPRFWAPFVVVGDPIK